VTAAVLRREAERLIDGRVNSNVSSTYFTDYWLNLRALRRDDPEHPTLSGVSAGRLPRSSRWGWRRGPSSAAMVRDNLPATTLIEADFTFANDRLARHYGLAPLTGSKPAAGRAAAGQPLWRTADAGALLKISANGANTSPVLRGVWVMDRLLGQPPPPPPPGVPAVEPDIRGARTIREQLGAAHQGRRAAPAATRSSIRAVLALENFDVLGAWRTRYRGLENGERVARHRPDRPRLSATLSRLRSMPAGAA
jgi:hypothetical protein